MPSPLPAPVTPANGFPLAAMADTRDLPLHGVTILAVEDSRFASEALRLMCRRAGARLRRAETLAAARAHLRVYRPDIVIVDLGLPDGKGEALIRELVMARPRPALVLGSSGAASGRAVTLAAGADGFLDKPLESLSAFCTTLLAQLPDVAILGPRSGTCPGTGPSTGTDTIAPDRLALHDDLNHAALLLAEATDATARSYVASFVYGVARHSHDDGLAKAASRAMQTGHPDAIAALQVLISARLAVADSGFATHPPVLTADLPSVWSQSGV